MKILLYLCNKFKNTKFMDIQKINQYKSAFDAIAKSINDGENSVEVWYARELQSVLGYARW